MIDIADEIFIEQLFLKLPILYKILFHDNSNAMIPATQVRVLMCLLDQGTQTISDLALHLFLHRQQLTKLIDALEEKHLVSRKECKENKRTILIELTASGHAYVSDLIQQKGILISAFFHQLPPSDQASLLRTLEIIDGLIVVPQ